jgi:ABC-type branched-subunit amino acid transport system permease subunit
MALVGFGYFFYYLADGHKGGYGAILGVIAAYAATRVWQIFMHDQTRVQTLWWVMIIGLALLAPFAASGTFRSSQLATASYTSLGVLGLNLLTGYTGQISLGHSAFVGIGAYGTAILINSWGVNVVLAMLIAAGCAALAGLLIGVPALRLSGSRLRRSASRSSSRRS